MKDSVSKNFQAISSSKIFINFTTAIIIVYSLILGVRTYESVVLPYEVFFMFLDYSVTVWFLIELIIRISAEEKVIYFFKDKWNVFDFIIITITLMPILGLDFIVIARLMRIFRVLRIITLRPELRAIIDVLGKSIPSIVDILVLLFIIFYIYAIIGSFMFVDLKSGLWENISISLLTLFRVFTFEDWTDVMYEAMEVYPFAWIYFVSFIFISVFVFFNLFVAVIVGEMETLRNANRNKKTEKLNIDEIDKLDLIIKKINTIEEKLDKK